MRDCGNESLDDCSDTRTFTGYDASFATVTGTEPRRDVNVTEPSVSDTNPNCFRIAASTRSSVRVASLLLRTFGSAVAPASATTEPKICASGLSSSVYERKSSSASRASRSACVSRAGTGSGL